MRPEQRGGPGRRENLQRSGREEAGSPAGEILSASQVGPGRRGIQRWERHARDGLRYAGRGRDWLMRPRFCHGVTGVELAPVPTLSARFSPMPVMIANATERTMATDQRRIGRPEQGDADRGGTDCPHCPRANDQAGVGCGDIMIGQPMLGSAITWAVRGMHQRSQPMPITMQGPSRGRKQATTSHDQRFRTSKP